MASSTILCYTYTILIQYINEQMNKYKYSSIHLEIYLYLYKNISTFTYIHKNILLSQNIKNQINMLFESN